MKNYTNLIIIKVYIILRKWRLGILTNWGGADVGVGAATTPKDVLQTVMGSSDTGTRKKSM
jgi:hypothetical protein